MCQVKGYGKRKRGAQSVAIRVNGVNIATLAVTVKVPAAATVTPVTVPSKYIPGSSSGFYPVYAKGMAFDPERTKLQVTLTANGETVKLDMANGGLTAADPVSWPAGTENQTAVIRLDDKDVEFPVYIIDVEPQVYFDYGYLRKATDPNGAGPGPGKYYVASGKTLVLSPVRFLIGYGADNADTGASYSWSVAGPEGYSASYSGEFYSLTPTAPGTYFVTVDVTGRNFITGDSITKSASTEVVCFTGTLPAGTFKSPLKNFAPGQFTQSGTGYGWSLGVGLGYEAWSVHAGTTTITITGNAFQGWNEPGIVWVQEDANGNGVPDEMWYEIRGSYDSDLQTSQYVSRRHAVAWFNAGLEGNVNEYGQIIAKTVFVDLKGRMGIWGAGWPYDWGVGASNWVI